MESLTLYLQPRVLAVLALGFSSGLPLALTASTLGIWLTEDGISMADIGLFALVGTPYTMKFLWSPLMDSLPFPVLTRLFGQRVGWLLATQIALAGLLLAMGLADPSAHLGLVAVLAFCVAICSASQDIVVDAYRVEILDPEQQGAGAAVTVLGYRFGMIASTAGALYLAEYYGWTAAYGGMAGLMGVGMVTALLMGEPPRRRDLVLADPRDFTRWLKESVIAPFADFMTRPQWAVILCFVVLYKFADAFMGVMTSPFLIQTGFTKEQIATIVKFYGLLATIGGSFLGGALVYRLGMTWSLWICGIAAALTNLAFMVLAQVGPDTRLLAVAITLENGVGGMGTAAFVAYMSSLCNLRFTATQYALLSSLAAFGRTWLSSPSGKVAELLGWTWFFAFSALLAIPGLILLWMLRRPKATSLPAEATSK